MSNPADITLRLCSACTMCCNGVLFADVELKKPDRASSLRAAGLKVVSKTKGVACIGQPCSALQTNGACSAYEVRPQMCRSFECRLLQRSIAGQIPEREALRLIAAVRKEVAEAEAILEQLGDKNHSMPLSKRYAYQMMAPFDLATGRESMRLRKRLMKRMDEISSLLSRYFLS